MPRTGALYIFSPDEDGLEQLETLASGLPVPKEIVATFEELKGCLEGGRCDYLLLDGKNVGHKLLECLGEPEPHKLLDLSLAQLEKRHIMRVLASTSGNKTQAARILGIDTKTLYNKLKSYQVSQKARQQRVGSPSPTY
jgi:DNA-binding NtrC family response regulator